MILTEGPLNITGNHLKGKSDKDVESLDLVFQFLPQLPDGIEIFFPNLKIIQIYQSNLESISKDVLKFPNLLILYLGHNNLVTLDGDLFEFTPSLEEIWFDSNFPQHVGHDLFSNLDLLREAFFRSNPCIDRFAVTRQEVLNLNIELPISCPPAETTTIIDPTSTSTTPDGTTTEQAETTFTSTTISTTTDLTEYCDICEWRTIEIVAELVDEQEARIVEHKNEMTEVVVAYEAKIAELADAVIELQKQMKEISENPCLC